MSPNYVLLMSLNSLNLTHEKITPTVLFMQLVPIIFSLLRKQLSAYESISCQFKIFWLRDVMLPYFSQLSSIR